MLSTNTSEDSGSRQNHGNGTLVPLETGHGANFYRADLDTVQRRLEGRHIQM